MRVRKVVTRSGKRFRGKFPSVKLGRMVHWESLLERDAILLFEYHPWVTNYQEQPSIEHYYDTTGKVRRYIPDFRLDFHDGGTLLIEVKPAQILAQKEVRLKYEAVAKRLVEQGKRFRILTENDIRRLPLFENLQRLHSSSKKAATSVSPKALLGDLPDGKNWTIKQLSDALGGTSNVFKLIRSNHLQIDLESELMETSEVWARNYNLGGKNDSFRI